MYDLPTNSRAEGADKLRGMGKELRVGVDARLVPGQIGGVEQTIVGLAHGLSQLEDGDEVYCFLVYAGMEEWIAPHLRGRCQLLYSNRQASAPGSSPWRQKTRSLLRQGWHTLAPLLGSRAAPVPVSDGVIERNGIEVMHFATPLAFRTQTPSLYQVQDVQHRALPENFSRYEILARDVQYQTFMNEARLVAVPTMAGRSALLANFRSVAADKVVVVPYGPAPTAAGAVAPAEVEAIARRLNLPAAYLFYPAQTWKHKNHLTLLQALAQLKDGAGLEVPLICSGRLNDFYPVIQQAVRSLGLESQVRFLGFVTPPEMQVLYERCRAVVFPSCYEGFGMPVLEALQHERPLACSNISPIAELAGDAALLFDPADAPEMAQAIQRIWHDAPLRETLCARAVQRIGQFSWAHTARLFRTHYRRIAGRPLSMEDQQLLAAAPLV